MVESIIQYLKYVFWILTSHQEAFIEVENLGFSIKGGVVDGFAIPTQPTPSELWPILKNEMYSSKNLKALAAGLGVEEYRLYNPYADLALRNYINILNEDNAYVISEPKTVIVLSSNKSNRTYRNLVLKYKKIKELTFGSLNLVIINESDSYHLQKMINENFIFNKRMTKAKVKICRLIEKYILLLFYFSLGSFIGLSFMTLQMWLTNNAKKDPLITSLELETCPIMVYKNIKTKSFDTCLICMEMFKDNESCRMLHCEHYFHRACVDPWLRKKSCRCPYCRRIIKVYNDV